MSIHSSGVPALELRVEEVVLEAPGIPSEVDVQRLIQEALELLAERLRRTPPSRDRRVERLSVDDFSMEVLSGERGAEALADALHTRLMGAGQ
ncbi:MAG: hypothetical protein JXB05_02450 [Myxococcaceae bacterium]|nr:hypothetical protein [Myxococcaceae bacterium]